ncbi:MAG: Hsp20/alpha crystallin family protein [Actinobacteria bacterium]|nr:Hsp20/alpha crystallin family protein [Actinomycetota bacterium]
MDEEKERNPEEQRDKEKGQGKKEEESVAGGILKGIGEMIPGLGGLFKGLEKSPAFKERLKKIDEKVERKLEEAPLKKTEEGKFKIEGKFEARHLAPDKLSMRKEVSPRMPQPQERPADIFDEKDYIKVIAEIPGVEEEDIKINLEKDGLTISVDVPDHKYHQELKLPREPKGKLEKFYRNGILEVKIKKI